MSLDVIAGGAQLSERHQAIVIVASEFKKEDLFGAVEDFWVKHCSGNVAPEIQLLVEVISQEVVSHNESKRKRILEWCIDKGFELVTWKIAGKSHDQSRDPDDVDGIERIRDALQAHMWPEMSMKSGGTQERKTEAVCKEAVQVPQELLTSE